STPWRRCCSSSPSAPRASATGPLTPESRTDEGDHMNLSTDQLDRAVGAVLASAAGDALGSQYEFGPSLSDDVEVRFGPGAGGHALGEWTDDTSMALPVLQVLAEGRDLCDPAVLAVVVEGWRRWAPTSP